MRKPYHYLFFLILISAFTVGMAQGILQDTGDYTEVDASNVITINSNVSVQIASDLDEYGILYYNFGADQIGDFRIDSKITINGFLSNGRNYAQSVASNFGSAQSWTDSVGIRYRYSTADGQYQIALTSREAGVYTGINQLIVGTPTYYTSLHKVGVNIWAEFYTDASRTSLAWNLTDVMDSNHTYDYLYWVSTDNIGLGGRLMDIDVDDVDYDNLKLPPVPPDPDDGGEETEDSLTVVYREYNVTSITVIDGTYDVGWLNSTPAIDGNVYRVNETIGADPLDVRFNWTNIPEEALSLAVLSYCEYEGNPAHIVNFEAWNFNTSEWILLEALVEHGFRYVNHSMSYGNFIENGTGNVWIRFDHFSNGANGHYLTVDYIKLRAYVPLINLDAWSINWLTSLLWIGLLGIGTFNKSGMLTIFAGFLGLILGLLMLGTNTMVGISLILLNLYLIYTGSE
jgi:hypothetical protein